MHQNIPPNNPRCRLGAGCASDRSVDRLFSCFMTWKGVKSWQINQSWITNIPPPASPFFLEDLDDAAQPDFHAQTR
jgi:hypothetical protein